MTVRELQQSFEQFEIESDAFELPYNQKHTWEVVRSNIYYSLAIHFKLIEKQLGTPRSFVQLFKILTANLYYIFFKSPFLIKKNKVVLLSAGRSFLNTDGKYWDIHTDYFIEEIGADKFHLIENMSFTGKHRTPARTKHIAYSDAFYLLVMLLSKFFEKTVSAKERNEYQQIEARVNNTFGTTLALEKALKTKLCFFKAEKALYRILFKWLKPKMVGVINAPNRKASLLACRELNIPTFEIQHGTMGKYHLGYYYPKGKQKIVPIYTLFMGKYWKNSINNPSAEENSLIIGHPFLESKQREFNHISKKKQALFISQALDVVFVFAQSLKKIADADIEIVVKLHPGEYGQINQLKAKFPEVKIIGPNTNIYQLLAESKWVFGVYSTVMFEALKFNCILYGINAPSVEYLDELVKVNAVKLVNKPEDVVLNFEENPSIENSNYFFQDNWEELVLNAKNTLGI